MLSLTLSQVIDGYNLAAQARRLSPHTLNDYSVTFRKLVAFLAADPPFLQISKQQLEGFLAIQPVGKKTLLNYHTGLSALWTFAYDEGLVHANLLHQIERPRPEKRSIEPFSDEDLRAMLSALANGKSYRNHGTTARNELPNQERNRAIILLLLDTGMRADELCQASIADLDTRNLYIKVFGKGSKERILPICPRTAQALWKYLAIRGSGLPPTESLFVTQNETPLDRHRLLKQLVAIGRRAGVKDVHPHRFRHTFAISFLRNGGNAYTLQIILGHSSMEMVKNYLNIAQADIQSVHRLASPVANMRL
jgi:site-specific recombinase XerD